MDCTGNEFTLTWSSSSSWFILLHSVETSSSSIRILICCLSQHVVDSEERSWCIAFRDEAGRSRSRMLRWRLILEDLRFVTASKLRCDFRYVSTRFYFFNLLNPLILFFPYSFDWISNSEFVKWFLVFCSEYFRLLTVKIWGLLKNNEVVEEEESWSSWQWGSLKHWRLEILLKSERWSWRWRYSRVHKKFHFCIKVYSLYSASHSVRFPFG